MPFPRPLDLLLPELVETIERGVQVFVQAYRPAAIAGATIAQVPNGEKSLQYWNSQQLNLVIDGREYLAALFDNSMERVIQANWTCNLYLACLMHAGRISEHKLIRMLATSDPRERENLLQDDTFFYRDEVPGTRALFERHMKASDHA